MFQFSLTGLRHAFSNRTVTNEVLFERLPLCETDVFESDLATAATQFWFANRREDGPPEWSCFLPEQHPKLLANVILYERINGSRYLTRLVGDAIVDYLPQNPVGHYLEEVMPADRFKDVSMRLDRTFSDGLPNYVEKARVWRHSGLTFDYTALSLPFISRKTGAKRVFCILEFNSQRLEP